MGRWIALSGILFVAAAIVGGTHQADPVSSRSVLHHGSPDGNARQEEEYPDSETIAQWKALVRANREEALKAWQRMDGEPKLDPADAEIPPEFRDEYRLGVRELYSQLGDIVKRRKPVTAPPNQGD